MRRRFVIGVAALLAALFPSCSDNWSDPVVLLVTASADTLTAGNKVLFELDCWSVEGELKQLSVSSFNEEQGEKAEKETALSGRSYKGSFSIDTPSVRKDTLNHTIFIDVLDSRGDKARFVSRHVLLKPVP